MAKWIKEKIRVKKQYFAFFTVVPLLLLLAVIKTPCPLCDGKGVISSTGMGEVTIIKVDSSLQEVGSIEGCINYIVYTYNIMLTLQNNSKTQDATGYVRLGLVNYKTSSLLASQYSLVTVPANMQIQTVSTTQFMIGLNSPTTTQVTAEVVLDEAQCKACGGTGKVSLNYQPLVNGMKKSFAKVQRIAVAPAIPPAIMEDLAHEYDAQAYNTDQWILEHPEGIY